MGKSLYSLILSDEVVARIDALAQKEGSNRSALVNNILAENVCYITPDQHIQNVLDLVGDYFSKGFEVLVGNKARTISLKSALALKYRPAITYDVELYKTSKGRLGELKINCRTGSEFIINRLYEFITKWVSMEEKYIITLFPNKVVEYYLDGNKLKRIFCIVGSEKVNDEKISKNIVEYIKLLDKTMKAYLYGELESWVDVGKEYINYLNSDVIMI
ncbi:MAG: hypothetical protein WCR54_07110 [Clostridia bacterium]